MIHPPPIAVAKLHSVVSRACQSWAIVGSSTSASFVQVRRRPWSWRRLLSCETRHARACVSADGGAGGAGLSSVLVAVWSGREGHGQTACAQHFEQRHGQSAAMLCVYMGD
eukprot:353414-Chlamydomonas_euryale.AAC.12